MSEWIKETGQGASDQANDWDALAALAKNYQSEPAELPIGSSRVFKEESAQHEAAAESFFKKASGDQKDALKNAGVRDARDAGEYLHEMASWEKQVAGEAARIDSAIEFEEKRLNDQGDFNGVNPITGERLPDSPFSPIEDELAAQHWRETFQKRQEDLINTDTLHIRAATELIKKELQLEDDKEDEMKEVAPRSKEALERESTAQWLKSVADDADKMMHLKGSVIYATLKRKIEREAEEKRQAEIK